MKAATCGSFESNDCLISVTPNEQGRIIQIESLVFETFGDQIRQAIESVLDEKNIENIIVRIQDKGALDYTIRARLLVALQRSEE